MNMNKRSVEKKVSDIFSALGNPFRIRLMLAIGNRETCVCHLETLLKKRQAFISQHLMALREAGLLETRREGKFIYYHLASPAIIRLIEEAAKLTGVNINGILAPGNTTVLGKCPCPHCTGKESEIVKTPEFVDATTIV